MSRLRALAPVFAALLLVQWLAAYGHCRVLAASALAAVPICSAHADKPATPGQQAPVADWDCPACHHAPFIGAVTPPSPAAASATWFAAAAPVRQAPRAALGPRAPPPPPRAPPLA